ncbi:unnamed protein product [Lactuca saligna]|uniref:BAH domain-containing protein n=1 Tax=Lactuca saligna TaxID=75948 RepID=A0AA35ZEN1_LACSI|nr:unnamed protein product [Lactuca saligna]
MKDRLSLPSGQSSPQPLVIKGNRLGKRKKMIVYEDEHEEGEVKPQDLLPLMNSNISDDDEEVNAKPIGHVVRVSGEGEWVTKHFKGFETDGISYELEDTVLVSPEEYNIKPSVAIIKDIRETRDGRIMVIGRRFYRPEIAEKEDGGKWGSEEETELFYSFDEIEFAAESVMHKCRVHFVPPNKTIPNAREYPGFFVEKVYDAKLKRLCGIVDVGYGDNKQHELFGLVQKTIDRIPSWPLKL